MTHMPRMHPSRQRRWEHLAGAWPRSGGSELTVPLRPPFERQRGGSGARRGAVGRVARLRGGARGKGRAARDKSLAGERC